MAECSHHFYFFYEAFLALVLTVGCLLRKCFYGIVAAVFELLSEVDRGEVALTDLLLRLELFVEASLVDLGFEDLPPLLKVAGRAESISGSLLGLLKGDSGWRGCEGELDIEVEDKVCFGPG